MLKDHAHTISCSICGEIKKKKMENSTDSRTGRLRYIYSTLSIYLARVELVKRGKSEMLERLISPGAPSSQAFYTHVISAPSLTGYNNNKYKNHFNEMKGDVGMSDQQK